MSPKEKAEELVKKFYEDIDYEINIQSVDLKRVAKECALICVDEIRATVIRINNPKKHLLFIDYWENVKKELNNNTSIKNNHEELAEEFKKIGGFIDAVTDDPNIDVCYSDAYVDWLEKKILNLK